MGKPVQNGAALIQEQDYKIHSIDNKLQSIKTNLQKGMKVVLTQEERVMQRAESDLIEAKQKRF